MHARRELLSGGIPNFESGVAEVALASGKVNLVLADLGAICAGSCKLDPQVAIAHFLVHLEPVVQAFRFVDVPLRNAGAAKGELAVAKLVFAQHRRWPRSGDGFASVALSDSSD